jgi:hypothetical protein
MSNQTTTSPAAWTEALTAISRLPSVEITIGSAPEKSGSGVIYNELLTELVKAEDARRASLESRSVTVITVSGTLVTLLLALAAAVASKNAPSLPTQTRAFLVAAVGAFLVAAVLAILTYAPRGFRPYDVGTMTTDIEVGWYQPEDAALRKGAADLLEQLRALQESNNQRGALLVGAVAAQVIAIALVSVAVVLALLA